MKKVIRDRLNFDNDNLNRVFVQLRVHGDWKYIDFMQSSANSGSEKFGGRQRDGLIDFENDDEWNEQSNDLLDNENEPQGDEHELQDDGWHQYSQRTASTQSDGNQPANIIDTTNGQVDFEFQWIF